MRSRFAIATLVLLAGAVPARAVEQCRFIQAKPEREACYERQSAELAAKRKRAAENDSKALDQVRLMRQEDDAVYQSMRGICRGC
jgi:hypothetical protein